VEEYIDRIKLNNFMKKIFLLIFTVVFAVIFSGCGKQYTPIQSLYPGDERMWDHIFGYDEEVEEEDEKSEESYEFESAPFGVILPHHSITAFNVAKFYEELAAVADPSMVVVIGPNHFELGGEFEDIKTCEACIYPTIKGDLELDEDFIEKLVDDGVAVYSDETFMEEHAIFTHTPFIKNYFPEAKLVPIILKWQIPSEKAAELGDWLDENLPEDALVIASIDFSHYVPDGMADFHDQACFATITNFDYKNIYDLELDSPSSIYAFLRLMEKRGYMNSEMFDHTNLTDYLTSHEEETTSHLYFGFFEGEAEPYQGVSILAFGNIPEEHTFEFTKSWQWDMNYDENLDHSTGKLLRDIRAKDDRFLVGADFLAFDLVDGECLEEEQNGMEIAFCKLLEDEGMEKEYLALIKEQAGEVDLVYLLFEYQGGGEIDKARKKFTRSLVKNGVDIFVGRGIEEVAPFETYSGSLLFHSLGDAIIDNQLITDLNALSAGMILGLHVTEDEYYIYTFPVVVTNGYPALADYSNRGILFDIFTEEASLTRKDELDREKGVVVIQR
jgi:AmmeMemoRadiSam system protein B